MNTIKNATYMKNIDEKISYIIDYIDLIGCAKYEGFSHDIASLGYLMELYEAANNLDYETSMSSREYYSELLIRYHLLKNDIEKKIPIETLRMFSYKNDLAKSILEDRETEINPNSTIEKKHILLPVKR